MVTRLNVRLSGFLGASSQEVWSIGLNYSGGAGPLNQVDTQDAANDIRDAIAATTYSALGTLQNGVSAQVTLAGVDVYSYGPSGPAVAHGTALFSPAKAFTGPATCPPQTTACITLLTAVPGRSFRGRVYWPQLAPTIGTDLKSSTAKGLGSGFVSMNNAIETALNPHGPWVLGVYSETLNVVTDVTSVRCGDVLDTQRRRRDALVETFTTTAV